jgi:hypothetical protein
MPPLAGIGFRVTQCCGELRMLVGLLSQAPLLVADGTCAALPCSQRLR